jgi:2-keto-4-pentenoate hydratase/2-oxohepta-3-ene-1,7-dioic acid hydratase in catechol pathway
MKLTTVKYKGAEKLCVCTSFGFVSMEQINRQFDRKWPCNMLTLIREDKLEYLNKWFLTKGREKLETMNRQTIDMEPQPFAPLYRYPHKIWGIGLNYAEHTKDLSEKTPTGIPGSFMKPDTTIIGPGDSINIPVQSKKTTAEAELGIIIGKKCANVNQKDWLSVVAGFTTILDMTAEDILRQNVRYLTLSKSFDTFFSFGPQLVTPDEIKDVSKLVVSTILNGKVHAKNVVANMTFSPDFLVSFLSGVMTLLPGDIISTGTPGAAVIKEGDIVECKINGFLPLKNPVKDLKTHRVHSS